MKRCFKCGVLKRVSEFYRHPQMGDGHLGKCIECAKADVRAHRSANLDRVRAYDCERAKTPARRAHMKRTTAQYFAAHPDRKKANHAVSNAVRDGRLVRQPCQVCGATRSHGHHSDYSKPLDVVWLCAVHHKEEHQRLDAVKRRAA